MRKNTLQKSTVYTSPNPAISATQQIAWQSLSLNSQKTYLQVYDQLEKWLAGQKLDEILLANYIGELDAAGKSPATITLVVAAVRWWVKTTEIPFDFRLIELKLKTIRRESFD